MAGQVRRVTGFAPGGGYSFAPVDTQAVAGPAAKTTRMLDPSMMQIQTLGAPSAALPSGPIRATGFDHINPNAGATPPGAPVPPGWPGLSNTVTGGSSQMVPPGWSGLYQTLGTQQPGGGVQTTPFNGGNSGGGSSSGGSQGGSFSNPLDAFGNLFGQMLTSYQNAYDQYRGDVENRYKDVTGGFLRRAGLGSAYAQGLQDDVLNGYENRYQRGMNTIDQLGGQEKADVNQRYDQLQAQTNQDLVSRGLTGTTIKPTMTLGNERERQAALSRVNERLLRERLGTDADLSGQALAAQLGLGQYVNDTTSGLSGDALNWMGSRNDLPPDMQGLMALGQMLGPALANSLGGNQQGGGAAGMPSYMLPAVGSNGGNPFPSPFNPNAVQFPQTGGGGGGGSRPGGGGGGSMPGGGGQAAGGGTVPGGGAPGGPWGKPPLPSGTEGRKQAKKEIADALGIPEDQVTPEMVDDYIAGNPVAPAGASPNGGGFPGFPGGMPQSPEQFFQGLGGLLAQGMGGVAGGISQLAGMFPPGVLEGLVSAMPQDPFLAQRQGAQGMSPNLIPPMQNEAGNKDYGFRKQMLASQLGITPEQVTNDMMKQYFGGGQWPGLPMLNQ